MDIFIGLTQHGYLVRHLLFNVQIKMVTCIQQIVLNCIIGYQNQDISRQYFQKLFGGLKIQLTVI